MLYSLDPPPEGSSWPGSTWFPKGPKAARDHCTPAHRTSYQVGRVRLSPPASPQPIASNGYCLIPDPAQHEKIRRRMPPWSPPEQSPFRSRASSITRTLTFCNPRQRKISLSPAFPGLACRGRMPRFLPVPQSNLLRAVGYGQSEENRKRSAKA